MKYAAIALDVDYINKSSCPFFIIDRRAKVKLFKSEEHALKFIKKDYSETTVLIGMIDDPTPIYREMQKVVYAEIYKGLEKWQKKPTKRRKE